MSDRLPFDPAPRPGEVAEIVVRARRRKAWHAAVPASVVAVAAVVLSLGTVPTPRADQRLELADDPVTTATETARPAPSVRSFAPKSRPVPTPPATVLPPLIGSPSPSRTAQPRPTGSPRSGERPRYRGELGPRVEEYGYPACRRSQLQSGSRTTVHAGFCIEPSFRAPSTTGMTDLAPALSLCYQSESVYNGFLEFATQEEADFALYEADVDDRGRTIAGRELYRFSDTVTYTKRAHSRRVLQGDCFIWQDRIDFDRARYGSGDFLLRLETRTTTFAPAYRVVDIPFSV